MTQRIVVSAVLLALMLCSTGCGSTRPSLTGAELTAKYPDKKYVQIEGVTLHYEQEGLGRPLVFLHGVFTSSFLWRNITPGLTYGHTIYSLDLMGFGFSEKPQHLTYSPEVYVSQLGHFLDTLHLENPILVGHDIGAAIVALYTIRNPGKVRKLILMDAPLYPLSLPFSMKLLRIPVVGEQFTGEWFLKRALRDGVLNQAVMTKTVLDAYLTPYHDDPGARGALLKCVREFDLQPLFAKEIHPGLAKIAIPTLVVWGDGDSYVPLDVGRKLDQDIPASEFVVVLRSGHYVQEERPEEVRAIMKEFLEK